MSPVVADSSPPGILIRVGPGTLLPKLRRVFTPPAVVSERSRSVFDPQPEPWKDAAIRPAVDLRIQDVLRDDRQARIGRASCQPLGAAGRLAFAHDRGLTNLRDHPVRVAGAGFRVSRAMYEPLSRRNRPRP